MVEQTSRAAVRRRLREAFERSGLTQEQLAKRCDASKAAVSDWFNPAKDAVPDGEKMARLPAALNVSGHWLLTGEGASVPGGDGSLKRAERAGAREVLRVIERTVDDLQLAYEGADADEDATKRAAKVREFVREQTARAERTPGRRQRARRRAS